MTTAVGAARITAIPRAGWRCIDLAVAAATLAVLASRVGAGPFLDGLRAVDGWALAAASGLAVLTTVCCAWRWRIVARGLGVDLPLGPAVAAYYRSLSSTSHCLAGWWATSTAGSVTAATRATSVAGCAPWRGSARRGRAVQVALTVAVLLVLPSPVHAVVPLAALALIAVAACVAVAARARLAAGGSRLGHGCAAPRPATCARRFSPGGRGPPSRSRRRSSSQATPPRS